MYFSHGKKFIRHLHHNNVPNDDEKYLDYLVEMKNIESQYHIAKNTCIYITITSYLRLSVAVNHFCPYIARLQNWTRI